MLLRKLCLLLAMGSPALMFGTTIGSNETTCPTASLAVYAGLGSGGCFVSGVFYNNFTLLQGFSNGATPTPTSASILISPNAPSGGLDFAYPVITRNYVSFAIQYDFDPTPITTGTLDLDVIGDVDVFESICPEVNLAIPQAVVLDGPATPLPLILKFSTSIWERPS